MEHRRRRGLSHQSLHALVEAKGTKVGGERGSPPLLEPTKAWGKEEANKSRVPSIKIRQSKRKEGKGNTQIHRLQRMTEWEAREADPTKKRREAKDQDPVEK